MDFEVYNAAGAGLAVVSEPHQLHREHGADLLGHVDRSLHAANRRLHLADGRLHGRVDFSSLEGQRRYPLRLLTLFRTPEHPCAAAWLLRVIIGPQWQWRCHVTVSEACDVGDKASCLA